jgi:histone H3/H4
MQSVPQIVVSDHIRELHREAESARLVRALGASSRGPSGWRRVSGAAARQLSESLESIALRLDPTVCRPSYGRE